VAIKNIVFDIGNVLVKWAPHEIISSIFPEVDEKEFYEKMRPIWIDLNLGKLSEIEAVSLYHKELAVPKDKLTKMMHEFKAHQKPLPGSLELLQKLSDLNFNLYSITDNIKEIMEFHRKHSDFIPFFKDIIVSADVGILKPDSRIYEHLLKKHNLIAKESVFMDDMAINVEGAISVGMHSFQFFDSNQCIKELTKLGIL